MRSCWRVIVWVSTVLALLSGTGAHALEAVSMQLKWRHQFQFAGYYAALEKGYYRDAGLDVRIVEGGPGIDPADEVENGRATFGVGNAGIVLDRHAGRDFVALAVIVQHSPAVLITLRSSGLRVIEDLAGKRLMDAPGSQEIAAMLKKHGVDYASLPRVQHGGDPHDLIAGKADLMVAYSTNEPFVFEQSGEPYNIFTPRTAGVDLYGDNLFATGKLVRTQPELVRAFREASLKGWHYALEHKTEIVDLILSKYPTFKSREALLFKAEQTAQLIQADLVDLGYQSEARWTHIAEVFAAQGMLPANVDVRGVIYRPEAPGFDDRLIWAAVVACAAAIVLGTVAATFLRLSRQLRRQVAEHQRAQAVLARREAVKTHVAELSAELQKAASLEELGRGFLSLVAPLVGAEVGGVFVVDGTALRFAGGYGVDAAPVFAVGEGLVGQCAASRAPLRIAPANPEEMPIRLGIGALIPGELLLLPVIHGEVLEGVVELAALGSFPAEALELLGELLPALAIALHVQSRTMRKEALGASP